MDSNNLNPGFFGQGRILELCADLASVESLSKLTDGQRLVFRERLGEALTKAARPELPADDAALNRLHGWLKRLVIPLVDFPRRALGERRVAKSRAIYMNALTPAERKNADELAPRGRYEEARLSDLGAPKLSRFLADARGKRDWRVAVQPLTGRVVIEEDTVELESCLEDLVWPLVQPGAVFPFSRCPRCRRVFVLTRATRLYCSPTCATGSNQDNRRAKVRENVRRYRARRKKERG